MDQVEEIKNKIDIVALINSYVPLKKAGASYKANCPFHTENSPSFVVSPERQIWHCFGCSRGGDCYSFLMEYEHMEFPEALRILAEKSGVPLLQHGYDVTSSSKKEKLYSINKIAADFYHYVLTSLPAGKHALEYLQKERKIGPKIIDTYLLGFAPVSGNALVSYLLKKKKYAPEEIIDAGLGSKRYSGVIDFFQGRLMFPLYDHRGNVIGFSGRAITEKYTGGKYINTRETLVYHKGSVFFGLNMSRDEIKKKNKALIMEGEFDVIASFQEGIENTVAIKGTALTTDQAALISRFAQHVVLCLDSDSAGQEAIKRSIPILETKGIHATIVEIPGEKDPDDAIKSDPISFKKAIKDAMPAYEVILNWLIRDNDIKSAEGKRIIGDQMLSILYYANNEIVKEHYLRLLAKTIDVPEETLGREMERVAKEELATGISAPKKESIIDTYMPRSREEVLEEYIVALVVQSKKLKELAKKSMNILKEYSWLAPSYGKILQYIEKATKHIDGHITMSKILQGMPNELVATFDVCFLFPLPAFSIQDAYTEEVLKSSRALIVFGLKRDIRESTRKIQELEKSVNTIEVLKEQENLTRLTEKLKRC